MAYIYIYGTADILREIYYGRYVMADMLRIQQKQPYLDKCPVPEALDCCVRTCSLRPTAPRTPLDRFIYDKADTIKQMRLKHWDFG